MQVQTNIFVKINIHFFHLLRAILFEDEMGNMHQQQLKASFYPKTSNVHQCLSLNFQVWVEKLGSRWRIENYLISNTTRLYRDDYEEIGALF